MAELDGLVDVIPREAIEAAASELAEQAKANAEKGYPWALMMGDRYAAEAVLRAAEPFLRRAWVLGVLHDQETVERTALKLSQFDGYEGETEFGRVIGKDVYTMQAHAVLRAALGVEKEQA